MYSHSIFPKDKPSSLSTLRLRLFVLRSNSTNNEWFATKFCTTVVSPWWFVMTLCRPWVSSSICLIPWLWTNQIENKCLHCTSLQTTDMLNHVVFLALVLGDKTIMLWSPQTVQISVFCRHNLSWKLSRGLHKNVQWFHTYKCWNTLSNCSHWLGSLFTLSCSRSCS